YNSTYEATHKHYSPALQLMRSVDQVVLQLRSNSTSARLDISAMEYPRAKIRVAGYDVVAANGGVWFFIPPMITFFILLTEIVMEKVHMSFFIHCHNIDATGRALAFGNANDGIKKWSILG